jgi:hypothetical protein
MSSSGALGQIQMVNDNNLGLEAWVVLVPVSNTPQVVTPTTPSTSVTICNNSMQRIRVTATFSPSATVGGQKTIYLIGGQIQSVDYENNPNSFAYLEAVTIIGLDPPTATGPVSAMVPSASNPVAIEVGINFSAA